MRKLVLALVALVALAGCQHSELRRFTIDVDAFSGWSGQNDLVPADSLIAGHVPIEQRVAAIAAGGAQGIEEFSLFLQLQNAGFEPVELAVYAHAERIDDRARLFAEGIRLTRRILVGAQSAVQIDARNYKTVAEGFDAVTALALGGDFYLYVAAESAEYLANANVPTVSVLVTIEN